MKKLSLVLGILTLLSTPTVFAGVVLYSESDFKTAKKVEIEKEARRHLVPYIKTLKAATADVIKNISADEPVDFSVELRELSYNEKKNYRSIFEYHARTLTMIKTEFSRYRGTQSLDDLLKEIVGAEALMAILLKLEKDPYARRHYERQLDRHLNVQSEKNETEARVNVLDVYRGDGCTLNVVVGPEGVQALEECD